MTYEELFDIAVRQFKKGEITLKEFIVIAKLLNKKNSE